jgi:hypothetical protein
MAAVSDATEAFADGPLDAPLDVFLLTASLADRPDEPRNAVSCDRFRFASSKKKPGNRLRVHSEISS